MLLLGVLQAAAVPHGSVMAAVVVLLLAPTVGTHHAGVVLLGDGSVMASVVVLLVPTVGAHHAGVAHHAPWHAGGASNRSCGETLHRTPNTCGDARHALACADSDSYARKTPYHTSRIDDAPEKQIKR